MLRRFDAGQANIKEFLLIFWTGKHRLCAFDITRSKFRQKIATRISQRCPANILGLNNNFLRDIGSVIGARNASEAGKEHGAARYEERNHVRFGTLHLNPFNEQKRRLSSLCAHPATSRSLL